MLKEKIYITGLASISALGSSLEEVWQAYQNQEHYFSQIDSGGLQTWVAALSAKSKEEVQKIQYSDSKYKKLDDTVLFALYASRQAMEQAGWKSGDNFGINIGSSRGATALFERYHKDFLASGASATLSSPTTTLGNISSWIAHDLGTQGPEISHSITCSTGLHAVLNGVAWLNSGLADKFLVGGSEAPLTPFTIAQMKALKIYAPLAPAPIPPKVEGSPLVPAPLQTYPCQALHLEKTQNTMVLGEGAAVVCLENTYTENALAAITGVGYATEALKHNISISSDAICFQHSMKMALKGTNLAEIDAIVMHAPGTLKGDTSEYKAILKVFGNKIPFLTTNKWKLGHTFATSGMLNLELAIDMIRYNTFIKVPYLEEKKGTKKEVQKVLVNAVGFGGNAVSILVTKNT